MSPQLPTVTEANIIGRRGVTFLQERLEREAWLFRRQDAGDSDFGIDAEIELVQKNKVTGRLFKGQIKSSSDINWSEDQASVSVKVATYNLWRKTPLLTVLFLVDIESSQIFWTPALAHHPAPGRNSMTIRFDHGSDLTSDISSLADYVASWFSVRGQETIFDEVPYFNEMFSELRADADHYDVGGSAESDRDGRARLLYSHVLRLRLDLGLRNDSIPPLADWYCREAATWQSGEVLSEAVFSELMKFIDPFYHEALSRLRGRLSSAPLTAENYRAKNFVDRLDGRLDRWDFRPLPDTRIGDKEFQREFERRLVEAGVVKYPRFEGRR